MPNITAEARTAIHKSAVPVFNRPPSRSEGSEGEQRFVKIPGTEARIYVRMVGHWWHTSMKGALHQT